MVYSSVGRGVVVEFVQEAGNTQARSVVVAVAAAAAVVVVVVVEEDEDGDDVDADVDNAVVADVVVVYTFRLDFVSDLVVGILSHTFRLSFVAFPSFPLLAFYVYLQE